MQTGTSTALAQTLTPSEIELANLHLEQTRNGMVGAVTGLSDEQWNFRPSTAAWSIAEIAEHIAFVQERVLGILAQLSTAPPAPAGRNLELIDAIVINYFPNRLTKFPAPEPMHPKGGCVKSEVMGRVTTNTREFARCLESMPELRAHAIESRPLTAITKGEHTLMDGYQWILAASAHTERHTEQILEVRADPNFPAN